MTDTELQTYQTEPAYQMSNTPFSGLQSFEAAQRMAKAITTSTMVPKHYQGPENMGNALIALEMAQRIGASLLMVCQNLYSVYGMPAWSAKFKVATFNQTGKFTAIKYEWADVADRKHDDYGCRAYAIERETGEIVRGPWITWALVKAEGWNKRDGSKWLTMPEKMFMYRAASWMIDAVAPEISMGLQTEDEVRDVIEIDAATGEVIGGDVQPTSAAETVRQKIQPSEPEPAKEEDQAEATQSRITNRDELIARIQKCDTLSGLADIYLEVDKSDLPSRSKGSLFNQITYRKISLQLDFASNIDEVEACRGELQKHRLTKDQHNTLAQAISQKIKSLGTSEQAPPRKEADNGAQEPVSTTAQGGPAGREQEILEQYADFVGMIDLCETEQKLDELERCVNDDPEISIFAGQVLKKRIRQRFAKLSLN